MYASVGVRGCYGELADMENSQHFNQGITLELSAEEASMLYDLLEALREEFHEQAVQQTQEYFGVVHLLGKFHEQGGPQERSRLN